MQKKNEKKLKQKLGKQKNEESDDWVVWKIDLHKKDNYFFTLFAHLLTLNFWNTIVILYNLPCFGRLLLNFIGQSV